MSTLTDEQIENETINAVADLAGYLENQEIGVALSDVALREMKRQFIAFAHSLLEVTDASS